MPEIRQWWRGKVGESRWVDLIVCPFCLGMWMAAFVVVLRVRCLRSWPWIARVLAGSSVAGHLAHLAE